MRGRGYGECTLLSIVQLQLKMVAVGVGASKSSRQPDLLLVRYPHPSSLREGWMKGEKKREINTIVH